MRTWYSPSDQHRIRPCPLRYVIGRQGSFPTHAQWNLRDGPGASPMSRQSLARHAGVVTFQRPMNKEI
jgi:hypothetical protein